MADIKTARTQKELDLIEDVMGSSFLEHQSYVTYRDTLLLKATREANLELMRKIDAFCEKHGIKYFVYGKTLAGIVAYQDFLPGNSRIDLGFLRPEMDKFEAAFNALTDEQIEELGFKHNPFFTDKRYKNIRRIYAHIDAIEYTYVEDDLDILYGDNTLPMVIRGMIQATVFDEVPDDFFTRKKFYRQMKRRSVTFRRTIASRHMNEANYEDGYGAIIDRHMLRYKIMPLRLASWRIHHLAKRYQGRGMNNVTRMLSWRSYTVPKSDIGETQRMNLAGLMVRCPDRPDIWGKEPILETTPELRRLQNDAKEIVVEIDRVCQELGIQYFACGGTMLGYVRHGGFIPWDDDIDIGMLRADYERFKAEAGAILDGDRFFLQTRESDPNIPYLFSKVRMNDTEYITDYNKFRPFHKGICVDVFPFDYIPNDFAEQRSFKSKVRGKAKAHHRVVNRQYPKAQAEEMPTDRKNLDWMIAQNNGKILAKHYWGISLDETQKDYDETVTCYNDVAEEEGLEYVASFVPSYTMAKVEDLYPAQRVEFDGIEIMLPKNPEKFLRMQYGDYMVPPYPHQRVGHDLLFWADAEGVGGGREAENDFFSGENNAGEE
ncbi:LicD family protein [Slackia heliotrinireducens]|uniref:LicD family protein n=1 Tax=Slackia heliotrinireducens TaxID=84110 RepID=UPI003314B11E